MREKEKILIVDDNVEDLFLLDTMLHRNFDIEVLSATSGHEALSAFEGNDFALVILDVQMEEMNGYELAEAIREREETTYLPIIFISGVHMDEFSIFKGYKSGAVDYLTKPYKHEILISKTQVFLDLYRQKLKIQNSLSEKETLLYEIHHRVKNNMAIISSLLSLQANSVEDDRLKAALLDSQNRVRSMSIIHETLYQSENLSSIDLRDYLSKLAESIVRNIAIDKDIDLNIVAEEIAIAIKQASPLGLIVNELITNSCKHAFPETQGGEITIVLRKRGNQVELVYSDNGVGMAEEIDWKETKSMGLNLVRVLAENQLAGSIEVEPQKRREFTITFNMEKG